MRSVILHVKNGLITDVAKPKWFTPCPQLAPLVSTLRHLRLDLFSLRGDEGGWRALLRPLGEQLGARAPASAPDLMAACADALVFAATRAPAALQVSN